MSTMASQITRLTIAYSTVYSGADKRIHRRTVNSPHKRPVTWKMFTVDDANMWQNGSYAVAYEVQR